MSRFTDESLAEIVDYIRYAVFSEKYARLGGFLQGINPELKLISFLALIVSTVLARSIVVMALLFAFSLLLAHLSRIPFRFYIPRVLMFIPLFTGIIVLPYLFNIFQPYEGTPLLVLHEFHRVIDLPLLRPFSRIAITEEGVVAASLFLVRVTTAVSFAILLILTTRWSDVMRALTTLRFPRMFILSMSMAYRYIFLLLDMVSNMLLSRKSRTVGKEGVVSSWKLNADIVGALFLKSYDMSTELYLAMLSRGFSGKPIMRNSAIVLKAKDYLFLSTALAVCLLSLGAEAML